MMPHRNWVSICTLGSLLGLLTGYGCVPLSPEGLPDGADATWLTSIGSHDSSGSAGGSETGRDASDSDSAARRRDAVTTNIDWSFPFSVGVWHMTFVATPTDPGMWDVRAQFQPDGIGYHQCSEPCAGDVCRFWDMRGTARTRVLVDPGVATDIAAEGCYMRSVCGDRTPVTLYCTLTIDATGVASAQRTRNALTRRRCGLRS